MNIIWLLNRLRSMGPAEIGWRVKEQLLRRRARGRLDRWDAYDAGGTDLPTLPGFRSAVDKASPDIRNAIETAAERVLAGQFSALGVTWPQIATKSPFDSDVWTLDPVTGRHWPGAEAFAFDIGYRHSSDYGDIKYAWEYHRLQFLQPVAAYHALSGSPEALAFVERVIESWFNHNPPYRGIGWNSGIELALRAISLLVVSSCCGERLSTETRQRIRLILVSHLRWMQRYPSGFSSANNHLVAECAGEFLIALAMPDLPDAGATLAKARTILEREADKQILADGVPAEQSPTYGAFTSEFLLLCAWCARKADVPMHRGIEDALLRFAKFIGWIALSDGSVPKIGDDDEGRVLSLAEYEHGYAVSVASSICGYLDIQATGVAAEPTLRGAIFEGARNGTVPCSGTKVFRQGGYSVFRGEIADKPAMLVLDHGPLGYLSIAAHGHADALALQLYLQDRPILVDPGTYLYHSGGAWRDWFRGTAAHNTLCLGGQNQSTITGAFNWSHKAEASLVEHTGGTAPVFRAKHDGYMKEFGLLHERTVSVSSSSIRIADRLIGDKPPPHVGITYQLAPGIQAEIQGNCVLVSMDDKPVLRMRFPGEGLLSVAVGEGPERGGWVSETFGMKEPAPRIVWSSDAFPTEAVTEIEVL